MRKAFLAPVLAIGLLGAAAAPAAADDSYRGYDRDYHHSDYHDRDYRHSDDRDRGRDYWRARYHRPHRRYCRDWGWRYHTRYCHGWGWRY